MLMHVFNNVFNNVGKVKKTCFYVFYLQINVLTSMTPRSYK